MKKTFDETFANISLLALLYNININKKNEITGQSMLYATWYFLFMNTLSFSHIYKYIDWKEWKLLSNLFNIGKKNSKVFDNIIKNNSINIKGNLLKMLNKYNILKKYSVNWNNNFLTILLTIINNNKNSNNLNISNNMIKKINNLLNYYNNYSNKINLTQYLVLTKWNAQDNIEKNIQKDPLNVSSLLEKKEYINMIKNL